MKLVLNNEEISLEHPKIMGVIDVHEDSTLSVEQYVQKALSMQEYGAEFLEIGISSISSIDEQTEIRLLMPIISAIAKEAFCYIAVTTSNPNTMYQAVQNGAHMIIDPLALKKEGALQMVSQLNVPVCLVFDSFKEFDLLDHVDPMASVSEFLYERIDACLNAGINRKQILIDPSLGLGTPLETRLKMLGRLNTFKSFALPISTSIPRSLPYEDIYLRDNLAVVIAITLFSIQSGVHIIRTRMVSDIALAIDTYQAASTSARPFKLTKAIASRFKKKNP